MVMQSCRETFVQFYNGVLQVFQFLQFNHLWYFVSWIVYENHDQHIENFKIIEIIFPILLFNAKKFIFPSAVFIYK